MSGGGSSAAAVEGERPLRMVFLGLSVSSSWGNGHATTYRALLRELAARGHDVLFLERDMPWYAEHRDLRETRGYRLELYRSVEELERRHRGAVAVSDLVVVGSYVPEGVRVAEWATGVAQGVTAFYDIDTPVTIAKLERGDEEYLSAALIPRFDLYLSFTGGPTLERLEQRWGARSARAFYCSADPEGHAPREIPRVWELGYLGTYSPDRQPALERLLLEPARQRTWGSFVVAGPTYPREIRWPANVARLEHVAPADHVSFYSAQRFTLNVTRADMVRAGWSPSVRLFEAAACGVPIISDRWEGLDSFFVPGREILIAEQPEDVLAILADTPEEERRAIGARARTRVLREHTAGRRAAELAGHVADVLGRRRAAGR